MTAPDDVEEPTGTVLDELNIDGLWWPPDYLLMDTGLWHVTETTKGQREHHICHWPMAISRILTDTDDASVYIEVAWHDGHQWKTLVLPREHAMVAGRLVAYARLGLPVDSTKSAKVTAYLSAFERANIAVIPTGRAAARLGWHGDAFAWGHIALGDDEMVVSLPAGTEELAEGMKEAGDAAEWVEHVLKPVSAFPWVLAAVFASVAPLLVSMIREAEGFTFELAGITSGGKTTALSVAASVWGAPSRLIGSWDATRVGIETRLAASGTLPVFLDDTASINDPALVEQVLYDVTKGRTRARGRADGGIRATRSWQTVLLSTGEEACVALAGKGGARMRSVCLLGHPFERQDPETAKVVNALRSAVHRFHGHLGPAVVRVLQGYDRDELELRYRRYRDVWASSCASPFAFRLGGHLAVLQLAGEIIEEAEFPLGKSPHEVLQPVWRHVVDHLVDVDPSVRALRDVYEWMLENEAAFYGGVEDGRSTWVGAWQEGATWTEVAILPRVLERVLQPEHRLEPTLRAWAERGWLVRESERRLRRRTTVGNQRPRCVVILRAAFEEINEADAAAQPNLRTLSGALGGR